MKQMNDTWESSSENPEWHTSHRQFEEQIGPHIPVVRATARRILGNGDDAADAVQEALIALWQFGSVPEHLRPWLIRTVIHRSLHSRRSRLRRARWEDLGGGTVMSCAFCDPERDLEIRDLLDVLDKALASLSAEQRRVIELRDLDGLEYQEIAERLDVPVGTVRSRLNRARARVRETSDWVLSESA